ncbi:MAG: hypothetical protein ABH867_04970 [Patescibacteria group bacterium]|nr:hypothetical protein [Patescibacteria group bacterium]
MGERRRLLQPGYGQSPPEEIRTTLSEFRLAGQRKEVRPIPAGKVPIGEIVYVGQVQITNPADRIGPDALIILTHARKIAPQSEHHFLDECFLPTVVTPNTPEATRETIELLRDRLVYCDPDDAERLLAPRPRPRRRREKKKPIEKKTSLILWPSEH